MELIHYAPNPVTLDRSRTYEQLEPDTHTKPQGLWVSPRGEYGWREWCLDEGFHLMDLAVEHQVTFLGGILHVGDLLSFQREYGVPARWGGIAIDWRAVAEWYDGVVIAPYRWEHRFNLSWYYGWDCASGCIWNMDAIESLTVCEGESA